MDQQVPEDVDNFLEQVNEVTRLVEGLQAGTISPEYIDRKQELKQLQQREREEVEKRKAAHLKSNQPGKAGQKQSGQQDDDADDQASTAQEDEELRREKAMEKAKEIVANRERKLRARLRYEQYVASSQDTTTYGTDYTKWDIWCPDDEEDDLINSMAPNTAEFKALEKDIEERHRKMVEARQIAERCRVRGNDAFKAKQWSEALRCYQEGIDSERTNMTLHANAAMAALRIQCYVQAVEHCDKVLHIADFLHNNLRDPLCVKAYQRRATAYSALQQPGRAVADLQAALDLEPGDAELQKQMAKAQVDLEEYRKQRTIQKAVAAHSGAAAAGGAGGANSTSSGSGGAAAGAGSAGAGAGLDLEKLGRVERLSGVLAPRSSHEASTSSEDRPQAAAEEGDAARRASRGPQLPARKAAAAAAAGAGGKAAGGRAGEVAAACKELQGLVQSDDMCSVYLRECGGLQHLAAQICKPEPPAPNGQPIGRAPLLALLNDACMNDGNLKQLPALKVLPACVACVDAAAGAELAAVAVNLLCTATTSEDVRRVVSQLLGTQQQLLKLVKLLQASAPAVQALALALMGNCMVDKPGKQAMAAVWADAATPACFGALLASASGAVAEKAVVTLGNMCADAALRQAIASHEALLAGLLRALTGSPGAAGPGQAPAPAPEEPSSLQLAAATTVFNVVFDAAGQHYVAAQPDQVAAVYAMLGSPSPAMRTRAAGIVARVAKVPAGAGALRRLGCIAKMAALCSSVLAARDASCSGAGAGAAAAPGGGSAASSAAEAACDAVLDAAVRTLTILTTPDDAAAAQELAAAGGVATLLQLAATKGLGEALLGNAALCVANLARYKEHLPLLQRADAVAPLVKVAYEGKGNTASKNAAIALARMAHDPAMLERLRELHGVEIIYQYVKP